MLDVHVDADHNRSVFTVVGGDDELVDALVAAIAVARDRIDLRRHEGVHPRIGAADVVPVVPIEPGDMDRARRVALTVAERVGELGLPVFVYAPPERGPAFFRRGGVEELQRRIDAGELAPDFGPSRLDPSAGGVIVGARRPLIAFNVNLRGTIEVAREIAAVVREGGSDGFAGRAGARARAAGGRARPGVDERRGLAGRAARTSSSARIESEARRRGAEVAGCELVGLIPAGAAAAAAAAGLRIDGFDDSRILELRL